MHAASVVVITCLTAWRGAFSVMGRHSAHVIRRCIGEHGSTFQAVRSAGLLACTEQQSGAEAATRRRCRLHAC